MAVQYLRIQVRRDSKANWATANPVLLLGEVGYETDTKKSKTGDGALSWSNLPYDKAGIVSVGEGLAVDEDGVLINDYDHSADLGDLGDQTVKAYVDAQDAATLESAKTHSDAVSSGKASKIELEAEVNTLEGLIADETNARQVNDNNLQGQINANYTEFTTYTGTAGQRLSALESDSTTQTAVDAGDAVTLAAANTNASQALSAAVLALEAKDNAQDPLIQAAQTAADDAQADATANAVRLDVLENADPATVGSVAEAKKAGDDAQATADTKEDAVVVVGTGTVTDGTTVAGAITELETAVDANATDISAIPALNLDNTLTALGIAKYATGGDAKSDGLADMDVYYNTTTGQVATVLATDVEYATDTDAGNAGIVVGQLYKNSTLGLVVARMS